MANRAHGKYEAWLAEDQLERVTNWAAHGCTMAEIAQNMGINPGTLYRWQARHPSIGEAIRAGRALCVQAIENTAFRLAMGLVEEEQVIKVRNPDGGERTELRKRRLPPNATMLIFLLKNRAGYRDNPPEPAADGADAERFLAEWRDEG